MSILACWYLRLNPDLMLPSSLPTKTVTIIMSNYKVRDQNLSIDSDILIQDVEEGAYQEGKTSSEEEGINKVSI